MAKSDWYRDRAAESDRRARATTKPATRGRHIKDRDGWLEIAASVDAADAHQKQCRQRLRQRQDACSAAVSALPAKADIPSEMVRGYLLDGCSNAS